MKKKIKILYITYVELSSSNNSGSGVRPTRIYRAFLESGYEVMLLSGHQMDKDRKCKIKKLLSELTYNKPDLCYIESPTYPIMRHSDRRLIRKIHKMGIPIGYFYRDFYWKFPEQFPRRSSIIGKIKDLVLDFLQYLTDELLHKCDIVYFPSQAAADLYCYKNKHILPPAGQNNLLKNREANKVGIYVGGIIGHYDITVLLNTYDKLYNTDNSFRLLLVCRKSEWDSFDHPCKFSPWLEVYHISGEELVPLYKRASIAFVTPKKEISYNNMAVSVKVYEYLSFGLPIIAVNCDTISKIIEKEEIGFAVNPNIESFLEAIRTLTKKDVYNIYQYNIKVSLIERNLWKHRVEKIVKDLSKI